MADATIQRRQVVENIRQINDPHTSKVVAVIEDMLEMAKEGRMPSLLFIIEETGRSQPHYGIVGRYRSDPAPAIGHLAIMKAKVTDFAADRHEGLGDE